MNWNQLGRGDKLWINGEKGEVKSIKKIYRDDILTSVTIETWVHTSELLMGRYTGPNIYFYRLEKNKNMKNVPDEPCGDLGRYFEMDEDMISDDGAVIVSLSEKSAEEAKRILEEKRISEKRLALEIQITALEEEIEDKQKEVIRLKGEIANLARPEN